MSKVKEGDKVKVTFEGRVHYVSTTGTKIDVMVQEEGLFSEEMLIEYVPLDSSAVTVENLSPQTFEVGDIIKRNDAWGYEELFTVLGDTRAFSHTSQSVDDLYNMTTENYEKVAGAND